MQESSVFQCTKKMSHVFRRKYVTYLQTMGTKETNVTYFISMSGI